MDEAVQPNTTPAQWPGKPGLTPSPQTLPSHHAGLFTHSLSMDGFRSTATYFIDNPFIIREYYVYCYCKEDHLENYFVKITNSPELLT